MAVTARFRRLYGDNPLHLFAQIITLALAGYAASRVPMESDVWLKMLIWFVGAALGHDLVLYPLYALADSAAHFRLFRRARPLPHVAGVPWINYLRVPVGLSLLLLLVWWPLILSDAPGTFFAATGLTTDVYLGRWSGATGVFVLVAAVLYTLKVRRAGAPARAGARAAAARAAETRAAGTRAAEAPAAAAPAAAEGKSRATTADP